MEQIEIEKQGYRKLVADHCQLTKRVDALTELMTALAETTAALDARISELEYLMSEELMRNLLAPIEPPNASAATSDPYPVAATTAGVTADSWLPEGACWVTQYASAVDGASTQENRNAR